MLVLFDLDGTLLDSLEAWLQAYKHVLGQFKISLTEEEIINEVFFHTKETLEKYGIVDREGFYDSVIKALNSHSEFISLSPNAEKTLAELKNSGHKIGVFTARDKRVAKLGCPPNLLELIDVFIDRHDCKPKPAPDAVFFACNATGTPIEEVIVVGDAKPDFDCARAAGVPFLLYKPSKKFFSSEGFDGAQEFNDFSELPSLVIALAK